MGTLSPRPPAPGAQLAGPSEQFATVGGGPPRGTKSSLDPTYLLLAPVAHDLRPN